MPTPITLIDLKPFPLALLRLVFERRAVRRSLQKNIQQCLCHKKPLFFFGGVFSNAL